MGPAEDIKWEVHHGRRATVHAAAGSHAARNAARELRDAERAIAALEDLLEPSEAHREFKPDIFLVDPSLGTPMGATVGNSGIVRTATRPGMGEPVIRPLADLLVPRWFATSVAKAFIDGIAGLAAARAGIGPGVDEADDWVRQELAAQRPVSVFGPGPAAAGALGAQLSATSFVAFLVADYTADALRRFLARYQPDRADEAAVAAFEAPLGAVTELWTTRLQASLPQRSFREALRGLVWLLAPYRWRYAEVVAYQAFAVLLALVLPVVSGCVVGALRDEPGDAVCRTVAPTLSPGRLAVVVAGLAIIYVADALVSLRRTRREDDLFDDILTTLRERLFERLVRQSPRFHARHRQGDLAARLTTDTATLEGSLNQIFGSGATLALTALAGAVTVLAKSPLVGLLVLVVLPAFVVIRRRLGDRITQAAFESQRVAGELVAVAQESLAASSAVAAYGLEARMAASYRARLGASLRAGDRLLIATATFVASVNLALRAAQLTTLGIGGYLVHEDRIGAGTVVTLLLLLPLIIDPVASLLDVPATVASAAAALDRVTEITDAPIDLGDRPGAASLPPLSRDIRFDAVTFGYRPAHPVIDGLDLVIPAGCHVALVGPSGSGKSTVGNLVARLWDPDEGRILFDGRDLRDIRLASLRSQVALVSQETFVFDTTLRDNIAICRPGATDAEVHAATAAGGLTELVERLPSGYDTVVGERGVRLSGGQRRRLAVARAALADPAVLILDEATSGLDARTEAEVAESLQAVAEGRTTLTITHRLALAAAADVVVVIDDGRVVEAGPHHELVASGGLYQSLWREQERFLTGGGRPTVTLEAARLRAIPLFADLSPEAIARLVEVLGVRRYDAGDDLVRQGEPGEELFVLRRGEVDVFVDDGSGERRVNTMRERDYFGELALMSGQPRSATVRASVRTEALTLGRGDFLELLEREESLRRQLAALANQRRTAYDAAALAAGIASAARAGERER